MIKIHISYTPEDEVAVAQVVGCLRKLLPYHKVKRKDGEPYLHVYFAPKPTK